ncbi:uncharacterized protein ACWYII_021815 isoform 2-T2 [Salvelinus alpinus]
MGAFRANRVKETSRAITDELVMHLRSHRRRPKDRRHHHPEHQYSPMLWVMAAAFCKDRRRPGDVAVYTFELDFVDCFVWNLKSCKEELSNYRFRNFSFFLLDTCCNSCFN